MINCPRIPSESEIKAKKRATLGFAVVCSPHRSVQPRRIIIPSRPSLAKGRNLNALVTQSRASLELLSPSLFLSHRETDKISRRRYWRCSFRKKNLVVVPRVTPMSQDPRLGEGTIPGAERSHYFVATTSTARSLRRIMMINGGITYFIALKNFRGYRSVTICYIVSPIKEWKKKKKKKKTVLRESV